MEFLAKQIAPPQSPEVFADLCLALFQVIWNDLTAQRNGRAGENHHGVDIFGANYTQNGKLSGVYCQYQAQQATLEWTQQAFNAALAEADLFEPTLSHWIFATTANNDAAMQEYVRKLSANRQAQGQFAVSILAWDAIQSLLAANQQVARRFYPAAVEKKFLFWTNKDETASLEEFLALHRLYLEMLGLKNYRCLSSLLIKFEPKLTVLVAQNGAGKSTILDAIAGIFSWFIAEFDFQPPHHVGNADVRRIVINSEINEMAAQYPASVEVGAVIDANYVAWSHERTSPTHTSRTSAPFGNEQDLAKAMHNALAAGERVVLPLIAYYGTNRLRERATSSEAANAQDFEAEFFSRTAGYKDCLDPASSYKYFEKWFGYAAKADSDLRNQQREQMGDNYVATDTAYTPLIKAVAEAVEVVLDYSGWKNLRFSFVHMNLVMTHPELGVLEISQLSDGVRSMIAMVADIAHRAVRLNAFLGREAAIKTPGLVLIDEVDLHLHPAWQQVVLESMLKAFPGIQFIVTTHSPQVISSVPDQCIRILEAGQVFHAPKGTQGAESSRILKRVFGTELRPPTNENTKLLNAYLDLVFADRWAEPEALAMRQKLDEIFSDEEPELTRADLYIETRQWELADEENP